MSIAQSVKRYLETIGVEHQLLPHPQTQSSRETATAAHIPPDHVAKAVILNSGADLLMAVIPGDSWVKIEILQQELNRPLELTPETVLDAYFKDCQPGAIPPLGPAYGLETVLDEAFTTLATVYFEAGDHQHLVQVSGEDFQRLLSGVRRGHFCHNG